MGNDYYLGLDVGTDSVGYAVADEKYNLIKFHGKPAWGTTIFDAASQSEERRTFRSARRRLNRKKQRIELIQELFAKEIAKVDKDFYIRIKAGNMFRKDIGYEYTLFVDENYSDKDYYQQYPTIHHLIYDLMTTDKKTDIRLIYLACSWLVSHRGHFLSNIKVDNISEISDFGKVYSKFINYFIEQGYDIPWSCENISELGKILSDRLSITVKTKSLQRLLFPEGKIPKEATEEFPYNRDAIVKLLAGGTCKLSDIFCNNDYAELGSISLGMEEEKLNSLTSEIGEDYDLIDSLRTVYDWATLNDILGNNNESGCISKAKMDIFEQHKYDLLMLKYIVKKYIPDKYNEVFRDLDKDNYAAYVYHTDEADNDKLKKKNKDVFSKYLLGVLKDIEVDEEDKEKFENMKLRLESRTFMPKQKDSDNRVIPHQLYLYELNEILKKSEKYYSFLSEKDEKGLTVSDKIRSVFLFRIPYFVGPLNNHSDFSWVKRKAGKIYPWNFDEMVDLDASEQNFINRMTNTCSYLPGESVLPKESLMYHRFMVLNELNNIRINGEKISVELKQLIYNELMLTVKKVTKKKLCDFLICNNIIQKNETDLVTGVDINLNANLSSQIAFKQLMRNGILTTDDVERIIERSTYSEDKERLKKWIEKEFPHISDTDIKYILGLKLKNFGRLSKEFLCGIEGTDLSTNEIYTILGALWNTQNNLMELLSDKFTFSQEIEKRQREYYLDNEITLEDRLNEMCVSNAVKRPIYRTLDIVRDIKKAFGIPKKIFIEMARGASEEQKGKRTKTRKQQILELYDKCKDEDVKILRKQLEEMGEYADNKLQGDKLFLYYMQLGKSMYSDQPIILEKLSTKEYDIDHIYPQAYVKDDSILNNKVLVLSNENGAKSDTYPISPEIRNKMRNVWEFYKEKGLITEEKYKRLIRSTPFSEDEKYGFINRQLTETSQSTKALAILLKEYFPETEIVYCKAKIVSEFRQEFDIYKSRLYNDLHHAVDAYLNIVTGNVYSMKFTRKWFNVNSRYSIKTSTLFTHPLICQGITVWDGTEMLKKVKNIAVKNTANFTKYEFFKHGGLFDQMPVKASEGLVPLKKGMDTNKYGGYNKSGTMFFIPTKYTVGKKTEVIIMSVELLCGKKFLEDSAFAEKYAHDRVEHILGKKVDSISFPMGMRPWKINTVLSLDGFNVCITGSGSGGKCLSVQPIVQFSSEDYWKFYLKKLEKIVEKVKNNKNYIYSEEYDIVSSEINEKLYDLYINKLEKSIYSKRVNNPLKILLDGKSEFVLLGVVDQAKVLINIHQVFGRTTGGCDLSLIKGKAKSAATVNFSSSISNWKKYYKDVRIIDSSVSGLWQKTSNINLLDLV